MKINRNLMGFLMAAAFCASSACGALANKIEYTFTAVGPITGTLGGAPIGGMTGNEPTDTITFTAFGDTTNALPFDLGGGAPHGWQNPVFGTFGSASITVTDNTTGATVITGTFLDSDKIFLSIDNLNGGVGIGSGFVPPPPTNTGFPGDPAYPFAMVVTGGLMDPFTYDLRSGTNANSFEALSCLGFPFTCNTPTALATTAGDLILGAAFTPPAGGTPLDGTLDNGELIVRLTSTPEPSTWALMLLGFAGLTWAGYRRANTGHANLRRSTG
jgi:PEP-CTERM motif